MAPTSAQTLMMARDLAARLSLALALVPRIKFASRKYIYKSLFRVICWNIESLKGLSDEFFTFLPKRLSGIWIERVSAHSFTYGADGDVVRNDMADMAVLAISTSDLVGGSNDRGPYRGCGSLRNGLPLERRFTLRRQLLIHLVEDPFYATRIDVATELGMDSSRMHGGRAHTTLVVSPVKGNSEEDIRRLRSAVGNEGLIGRPFKVWVLEIDIGEAVSGRRQIYQPPSCTNERRNPVDEYKVTQVIGAELRFKAVGGMAKRCGHHTCIRDDHIEGFIVCEQPVGAGAHAL